MSRFIPTPSRSLDNSHYELRRKTNKCFVATKCAGQVVCTARPDADCRGTSLLSRQDPIAWRYYIGRRVGSSAPAPEHKSCDESSRRKFKPGVLYYSWPLAQCQYIKFICVKSWLSNCVLVFDSCRCPLTVMRYMRMYCGWSSSIIYANGAVLWREQYPQKPTFGVVGVIYNNIIYPLPMLYTWSP